MAFAALGAHEFASAAIFESLGCGLVRFNLWQLCLLSLLWLDGPNKLGDDPVPPLSDECLPLLATRAQDHKHSTSLQTGFLLDMAYIL
jgi:hypothetical protein